MTDIDISAGLVSKQSTPDVQPVNAAITWRWATIADILALRICHFESEVAAGKELYFPGGPSDQRAIAVAERDGQIVGGLFVEDSVMVTMVGLERGVAESAYANLIPMILDFARGEGTRLVEVRLPREVKFDLTTGAEIRHETTTH